MIQAKTACGLMYDWHGGQTSPLYAAASSGLVADWDALLYDCNCMKDTPDYVKLTEWIKLKRRLQKFSIVVQGQSYAVLPWASRTYYP